MLKSTRTIEEFRMDPVRYHIFSACHAVKLALRDYKRPPPCLSSSNKLQQRVVVTGQLHPSIVSSALQHCNLFASSISKTNARACYGIVVGDGDEGGAGGRRADAVLQHDRRGEAVADGGAGGGDDSRRRLAGAHHAGARRAGRQQPQLPSSQRIVPLIN